MAAKNARSPYPARPASLDAERKQLGKLDPATDFFFCRFSEQGAAPSEQVVIGRLVRLGDTFGHVIVQDSYLTKT
jgi:hypothetical protein